MRVDREELLQSLESVQPGISSRDIMEQSSCFVFKEGKVITYNEEIACNHSADIGIEGAVKAEPLLNILRKLPEETLEVTAAGDTLHLQGKRRETGIRMEEEILLPVETIEEPKDWKYLPTDFAEAIGIVEQCASRDKSQFVWTCIHIHPKWVEACDNYQLSRYKLKTEISEPCLIRRESIKHILTLDMTQFSETGSWLHFRNAAGLILSCRRYAEEYKNLTNLFKVKGEPTTLPKGLKDAVDKAEVFSSENADINLVTVELRPGKLRINGEGVYGWYREIKKLDYKGVSLSFRVAPKLLVELVNRHNECEITEDRLKVDGGRFIYVANLRKTDDEQ